MFITIAHFCCKNKDNSLSKQYKKREEALICVVLCLIHRKLTYSVASACYCKALTDKNDLAYRFLTSFEMTNSEVIPSFARNLIAIPGQQCFNYM